MKRAAAILGAVLSVTAARGDVAFNGLYHNNTNLNALTEQVPVYLPATNFLNVNYEPTNVTVYFLTDSPSSGGSGDAVSNRVRFFSNGEDFQNAELVTNLVIDSGAPFHGTPAAGAVTVDLYRAVWEPTHGFTGTMYYSPQVRTFFGGNQNDQQYLVRTDTSASLFTNNNFWAANAQGIGNEPFNGDYSFEWTNLLAVDYSDYYFNSTNGFLPETEAVPGLAGQTFLQWNYATNLASYAYVLAPQGDLQSLSTRFFFTDGPDEMIRAGALYTSVVITSGAPFHGIPASGSTTLDVWRTEFWPPSGWSGTVYYAHQITTDKDGQTWLVRNDGTPNNLVPPQHTFAAGPFGKDWSFNPTTKIFRTSLDINFGYHNAGATSPQVEVIPTYARTNFLEVNYARTTTTFYVMTRHFANSIPGEGVTVQMQISSPTNALLEYGLEYPTMTFDRNLVVPDSGAFHGLPVSGTFTVDLWRLDWPQPKVSGAPITNAFNVYYAPLIKTTAGSGNFQTDYAYMTRLGDANARTNDYPIDPQIFSPGTFGVDYAYENLFTIGPDPDGDGIPDAWELQHFGTTTNGATSDNDVDGFDNLSEYIAATQPTNAVSYFRIASATAIGGPQYSFAVAAGRVYTLEQRDNLTALPDWAPYSAITTIVDGSTTAFPDVTNRRNYRVKVKLAP